MPLDHAKISLNLTKAGSCHQASDGIDRRERHGDICEHGLDHRFGHLVKPVDGIAHDFAYARIERHRHGDLLGFADWHTRSTAQSTASRTTRKSALSQRHDWGVKRTWRGFISTSANDP